MAVDNQKMEDNFNNIPIEELVDIVNNKSDDYDKDAIKMAYRILKERQGADKYASLQSCSFAFNT